MPANRGSAYTTSFPVIDALDRPVRKTGVSFSSGDTKISKDGGAYANTTNQPTEIGSTGRYKLDLTAAEMNAKWVHVYVEKSGVDPVDVMITTSSHASAAVVADGGNSATQFKTNLTQTTNDHWKDVFARFVTGNLAGQIKKCSAYDGTTKVMTFSDGFTGAPSTSDEFILVNE